MFLPAALQTGDAAGGRGPFEIVQDGAFKAMVAVAGPRELLEGCAHRCEFGDFPFLVGDCKSALNSACRFTVGPGKRADGWPPLQWALAPWVLVTPAGLKPSMVLEQNLPEPSFTQDCVEFSECQVRN